jgi:hypothetical protein
MEEVMKNGELKIGDIVKSSFTRGLISSDENINRVIEIEKRPGLTDLITLLNLITGKVHTSSIQWLDKIANYKIDVNNAGSFYSKLFAGSFYSKLFGLFHSLQKILLEKNEQYGDSALNPINVFSKKNSKNSLLIRIDDKLSRVKNSDKLRKNDVCDLMGYLVLLCIDNGWTDFDDLKD